MYKRLLSLLTVLLFAGSLFAAAPKYIFFFIGDGMGMGHVMSAQTYNRLVLKNDKPLTMMQLPVMSAAMTFSFKDPITDSAAAGTALSTGNKTLNGMLGMLPDSTTHVYSIAKSLQEKGYGIGITTSVPVDDATPAAFYAHVPHRKMFTEIGMDMAASGYDFFAGSNLRGDKDGKVTKALEDAGYTIVKGYENIDKAAKSDKVFLAPVKDVNSHCGFTIDSIPGALTLPQITKAAMDHMQRVSPDKFFLMIEGGNIDWAAHSNDGGAVVKEVINFDQCIKMAYDFYKQHPEETLIVITADHDTGGMAIGSNEAPKLFSLKNVDYQRISKDRLGRRYKEIINSGKAFTWADMQKDLKELLGIGGPVKISEKDEAMLKAEFEQVFVKHNAKEKKTLYATFSTFVEKVFKVLDHTTGLGWTTNHHTGNLVPVFAVGAGSEIFSTINNNIEIPRKIAELTGVELK